ncbi:MAG: sigma-54-dependent Fis family transcriptional regulator [Myxococcales bacterium]|nr:sigma-54-dependent Fis family transcriptional regulator [Myxococcales bacterium]
MASNSMDDNQGFAATLNQKSPKQNCPEAEPETLEVSLGVMTDLLTIETCKLVVVDGQDKGKELAVHKSIIRIGANERNDFVLNDDTVSRFHCEIRQVNGEYLLVDKQSTNGSFVGKLKVREAILYANCEILIGNSLVRFMPIVEEVKIYPINDPRYGDMVGSSARMHDVYGLIDKIAPSELSVVIEGETGTGKELAARAIHTHSRRNKGPLVIFDCSAFPENLLESELFGHEKGAFSGAIKTHRGVFERAEGGTVFFDELGEMSTNLQPKFLRALESGEIRRVGGERTIKIDVRIVAATNRNLLSMVDDGSFRQDLFYRMAKVTMTLPPLRDRLDDLSRLAQHFLDQIKSGQPHLADVKGFSGDALSLMGQYDWPGNIRELRNVVERSITFCEGAYVHVADLPNDLQTRLGRSPVGSSAPVGTPLPHGTGLKEAKEKMIAHFEKDYLFSLLERHNMNISRVAREAGIDRRHVYRLMKKYEINQSD